jgi:hypothetical protein
MSDRVNPDSFGESMISPDRSRVVICLCTVRGDVEGKLGVHAARRVALRRRIRAL